MAQPYEGKNPVVLGRLGQNPNYPTVAFYGHYDVQPAEEPDWKTHPFEMCAVDGFLCGRGTSDNKGPVLAFIYAVKVSQSYGILPINSQVATQQQQQHDVHLTPQPQYPLSGVGAAGNALESFASATTATPVRCIWGTWQQAQHGEHRIISTTTAYSSRG
jgi:hypothetical protein